MRTLQLHQPAAVPAGAVPGRAHGGRGAPAELNVAPASDILVVTASSDGARQLRARNGAGAALGQGPQRGQPDDQPEPRRCEKGGWKSTLARKRCIIPIDGFYEWQDPGQRPAQAALLHHPGLQPARPGRAWATWRDPDGGEELFTRTILTTAANDLMESVHHRMPVILLPEAWDAWARPREHRHRGSWPSC